MVDDPDIGRCAFLVDENWPELQQRFAEVFVTKSRDEKVALLREASTALEGRNPGNTWAPAGAVPSATTVMRRSRSAAWWSTSLRRA